MKRAQYSLLAYPDGSRHSTYLLTAGCVGVEQTNVDGTLTVRLVDGFTSGLSSKRYVAKVETVLVLGRQIV